MTNPSREIVIANPSLQNWREELRLIVGGARAADIEGVGSAEEYVERLLVDTSADRQSEDHFEEASNDVVVAWQPDRPERPYRTRALLQLIGAHTPPAGRDKVCEFIDDWSALEDQGQPDDEFRIRRLSLMTAARYFKAAPAHPETDVPFKTYVRLLRRLLDHQSFAAHAVARLIEISAMDLSKIALAERMRNAEFLDHIVDYFRPGLMSKAAPDALNRIFELCVNAGKKSVQDLVTAFEKANVPAALDEQGLSLYPRDGQRVELLIDSDTLEQYTIMRWESTLADDWLSDLKD